MNAASQDILGTSIEQAASRQGSVVFVSDSGQITTSWARLHEKARATAHMLHRDHGISAGSHIAVIGDTSSEIVSAIQSAWLAGCALTVLPTPHGRTDLRLFRQGILTRITHADIAAVIADTADPVIKDGTTSLPVPVIDARRTYEQAAARDAERFDRHDSDPASTALLQFTSGTTGTPRAVMIARRQLCANIQAIVQEMECDPDSEVTVSWLPLFHDMGLIGFLAAPMMMGHELVLAPPRTFAASPQRWMRWVSDFGGTVTGGPNSAYAVTARGLRDQRDLDLRSARLLYCGAEMIDPGVVDKFCQAGAAYGLNRNSPFCVYGLAEATLAVTFPQLGSGIRTAEVGMPAAAETGGARNARRYAIVGKPVAGTRIRIVDPDRRTLMPPGQAGEIEVSGPSVMDGYYKDPVATAQVLHQGWLRTGDLGCQIDGELVVCGRIKDVIIVGGNNIYPEEVEDAAGTVVGVRAGNVIAFGAEKHRNREGIVVVAEARQPAGTEIKAGIASAVKAAIGIPPADIRIIEPGALPKTSSGKLQRARCKELYSRQEI